MKTCTVDGCVKPHLALGRCRSHYRAHRRELGLDNQPHATPRLVACIVCGTEVERYVSKRRMPTCSNRCRRDLTFGVSQPLPEWHMARWTGKSSPWSPPQRRARFVGCTCAECGSHFLGDREAFWSQQEDTYCSGRCQARRSRRRRRAREHGRENHWRWVDLIGLWLTFDRCCAYCQQPTIGQPDPDHVVPLSRGGQDVIGNLLPACRSCNCDKSDLTLAEWQVDRERRGLAPRTYEWHQDDSRFLHLMPQQVTGPAWRDRAA